MRSFVLVLIAIGLVGCGNRGNHGAGEAAVARAPSRGGEVWETDKASDPRAAPATLVAFVNGLHTIVLDGHDVYAGTTTGCTHPMTARALSPCPSPTD